MAREPHLMKQPGSNLRLTMLDCQVGQHTGPFTITKTARGWACPKHMEPDNDQAPHQR